MSGNTMIRIVLALALAALAIAHHAEPLYDMKSPATIQGTVNRVEWSNPHVYLYLRVSNDKGQPEEWVVELTSPNALKRYGWTSTTLKPGDSVTCTGGRARSGARALRASNVRLPDGKRLKA